MTTATINRSLSADIGERAAYFADVICGRDFGAGDRAALRRMNPDGANAPAAFWRLLASRDMLNDGNSPEDEARWALILHGIALMTKPSGNSTYRSAHSPAIAVGQALYTGGEGGRTKGYYSEARLSKLLKARGVIRRSLIARLCRMMSSANATFDWGEMARFIYFDDASPRFESAAREIGGDIARAYYAAERMAISA